MEVGGGGGDSSRGEVRSRMKLGTSSWASRVRSPGRTWCEVLEAPRLPPKANILLPRAAGAPFRQRGPLNMMDPRGGLSI